MKKSPLLILLFVLGVIHLQSQVIIGPPIKKRCASLANVAQSCNGDGTVTITFRISNNSRCEANAMTIINGDGLGQSYLINLAPLTVSAATFTYTAPAGTTECYSIILYSAGRECCRSRIHHSSLLSW